jgi:hypothetical protein
MKWTGGDVLKSEAGVGAFADGSKGLSFEKGKGMPGRVLESGGYEWSANVQTLPGFTRLALAQTTGTKTSFCVAVDGGVVELSSTQEIAEDKSIVEKVKAMF